MSAFLLGAVSFALFALSDYVGVIRRAGGGSALFAAGGVMLSSATALLAAHSGAAALTGRLWPLRWLCLAAAGGMLALLIHTLFFALRDGGSGYAPPADGKLPLVDGGVYALCRHPGVLWLGGFYLALWGALGGFWLGAAFAIYSALDLFYVLWQDRVIFPRSISGYEGYRGRVPFLIPNRHSVHRCLSDFGLLKVSR